MGSEYEEPTATTNDPLIETVCPETPPQPHHRSDFPIGIPQTPSSMNDSFGNASDLSPSHHNNSLPMSFKRRFQTRTSTIPSINNNLSFDDTTTFGGGGNRRLPTLHPRSVAQAAVRQTKDYFFAYNSHHYYPLSERSRARHGIPKLVPRDLKFHQSNNRLQVLVKDLTQSTRHLRAIDWYHVFLQMNSLYSVAILLICWTLSILLFAGFYQGVDSYYTGTDCGIGTDAEGLISVSFGTYFAFSLETATTVGYGLPGPTNAFFEHCPMTQCAIFFQMVLMMLFNAFLFAFLFAALSRTHTRGAQVIFSEKAILKKTADGRWLFQVRVLDVDAAHPVVEAHVRLYAKKDSYLYPMRTITPDDDLGGTLFLSWPNTIVHHVDVHSPLFPPLKDEHCQHRISARPKKPIRFPHHERDPSSKRPLYYLPQRELDATYGNQDLFCCPVCSETYGTLERLRNHVAYNQVIEKADENIPVKGSHQEYNAETDFCDPPETTLGELQLCFPDEIICVVEGIENIASGTFQALQGYSFYDVHWGDGNFSECVYFSRTKTILNLKQFHSIVEPIVEDEESEEFEAAREYDEDDEEFVEEYEEGREEEKLEEEEGDTTT